MALPVIRETGELCSGRDILERIPFLRVIYMPAYRAYISVHKIHPRLVWAIQNSVRI
jgi:hypothetical protein